MEGGVRANVFDTTSVSAVSAVSPVASSKNADVAAIYATLALARSQNRDCHPMGPHMDPLGPKALQMHPKGVPRRPTGVQRPVKGDPKAPKGNQRETKVAPKASQCDPEVAQDGQREPRRAQLYKQTPDQPPKRPLCYNGPYSLEEGRLMQVDTKY